MKYLSGARLVSFLSASENLSGDETSMAVLYFFVEFGQEGESSYARHFMKGIPIPEGIKSRSEEEWLAWLEANEYEVRPLMRNPLMRVCFNVRVIELIGYAGTAMYIGYEAIRSFTLLSLLCFFSVATILFFRVFDAANYRPPLPEVPRKYKIRKRLRQ